MRYNSGMADRLAPIAFARQLRRNATEAERFLWRMLNQLRPRFTRQYPIGPYVADFACRRARLIVEVDGGQHAESAGDTRRSAGLAAAGWRVLRYWNSDVLDNRDGAVADIIVRGCARLPAGEEFTFVAPRPARKRNEEPPPAPPRSRGGE